jgi:hypothetical protein
MNSKEDEHHPIPPPNPAQMMASFNAIALLATNKPATSKAAGDVRCSALCGLMSDATPSPRSADFVAEVGDCNGEVTSSISRNGVPSSAPYEAVRH